MLIAYVLITTDVGMERLVVEALLDNNAVKEARILYGEYDIIMKIEVEDIKELDRFLLERVRNIKGIRSSSTLIATY